jgi:hypothetical protein
MARILKDILGGKKLNDRLNFSFCIDQLITKPLPNKDSSILPSPEDLKYKVLIRVSSKFIIFEKFSFLSRVKKYPHRRHYKMRVIHL